MKLFTVCNPKVKGKQLSIHSPDYIGYSLYALCIYANKSFAIFENTLWNVSDSLNRITQPNVFSLPECLPL